MIKKFPESPDCGCQYSHKCVKARSKPIKHAVGLGSLIAICRAFYVVLHSVWNRGPIFEVLRPLSVKE